MNWTPVFFNSNSAGMIPSPKGGEAGGYRWYMPSDMHGAKPATGSYVNVLHTLREIPKEFMPPWILEVRGSKIFIGEFGVLHLRLDDEKSRHPYARHGQRSMEYEYGFIGDLDQVSIPSYADMRRMSENWRQELSRLVTIQNENLIESFHDRNFLRAYATLFEKLKPDDLEIGKKYSNNLWDKRVLQAKRGEPLKTPVVVNLKELAPGADWKIYVDNVEIEGVRHGSKKKTPEIFMESENGAPSKIFLRSPKISPTNCSAMVKMAIVTGLTLGCLVGIWTLARHMRKAH